MISSWNYSRSNLFYSFYDLLKGFSKNFTCVSFAEPPKFGRRFLLLSGGDPLQGSLFSTISALSSAKGAGGSLVYLKFNDEVVEPPLSGPSELMGQWSNWASCILHHKQSEKTINVVLLWLTLESYLHSDVPGWAVAHWRCRTFKTMMLLLYSFRPETTKKKPKFRIMMMTAQDCLWN